MSEASRAKAIGQYLGYVVSCILVPLVWLRAIRVAKRHTDVDSKAVPKVMIGILLGLVLFGAGLAATVDFHLDGEDGMRESLVNKLSVSLGNEDYKKAVEENDAENQAKFLPNHDLFEQVSPLVLANEIDAAQGFIAARPSSIKIDEAATESAFVVYGESLAAQTKFLAIFVYPGTLGLLFAPLVFAVGSVLRRVHVPSKGVGFKQYPHTAAALFLVLGCFGIPALPFAAWSLMDMDSRSSEGQIVL